MNALAYPDALPSGYPLHWYVLQDVLGQGGFGITYLARDSNLDRTVAIKEYLPVDTATRLPDATVSPRTRSQSERYTAGLDGFLREARTLARFNHPNIVRVHSVFQHNNTAYMVTEYEAGETLAALLERRHTLTESELLKVLLPVMDGLALVHEAGFIHRDIKPENIMLRPDGSPVLLDFGSARAAMGRSGTMTILVAPGYAPYEQYYASAESQGPWTDIYGLGATCYRATTGNAPLDAIARSKGVLGSTREMLEPASVVAAGRYTPRLLIAIDHALAFAEKDRPQSLQAWRVELVAGSAGAPVVAPAAAQTATPPAASAAGGAAGGSAAAGMSRRELAAWVFAATGAGAAITAVAFLTLVPGGGSRETRAIATGSAPVEMPSPAPPAPVATAVSTSTSTFAPAVSAAPAMASAPVAATVQPALAPAAAAPLPAARVVAAPERATPRKADRPVAPARARLAQPVPATPSRPAVAQGPSRPAVPQVPSQVAVATTQVSPLPAAAQAAPAAPPAPQASVAASPVAAADPPSRIAVARAAPEALKAPSDEREAFAYYRRAALGGNAQAQFKLGELYASGRGVGQSLNQAYLWYGMAARAGDSQAKSRQAEIGAKLQPAEVRQVERYLQRTAPAASEPAQ